MKACRTASSLIAIAGLAFLANHLAAQDEPSPSPASVVVKVKNPVATEAFLPREAAVRGMIDRAVLELTGERSVALAWQDIVSPTNRVGIKVFSAPGKVSGTRPAVVAGIIEGLLAAGFDPDTIVIWDKRMADLGLAGYFELGERYGVRVAASAATGWDVNHVYESAAPGKPAWGDLEFASRDPEVGRRSHVTRIITEEVDAIISVAPLLNNNHAGVAGHLFSLAMGGLDNTARFETEPFRLDVAVPEIFALPEVGDRVVLSVTDALIGQYEGGQQSLLHYSRPLNEIWLSRDPVALDTLSMIELRQLRNTPLPEGVRTNFNLLRNASFLQIGNYDTNRFDVRRMDVSE